MTAPAVEAHRVADLKCRLPLSYLSFEFARSAGPGGQNVNKVSTQATLWFDLGGCAALRSHEKNTVYRVLGGRITKDGWLRVVSRKHRTQRANRRAATERFYELMAAALAPRTPRIVTSVPAREKRRRLQEKRRRSLKKKDRRFDGASGEQ